MKTIFAVDDSATIRASLEYTLSKADFKVELAVDGVNALEILENYSDNIDLFIFDVNMPNMDGITLLKSIRKIQKFKFTPVFFLTTESQEAKKLEGKNAGATGWIVKPFKPDVLISTLERFLK